MKRKKQEIKFHTHILLSLFYIFIIGLEFFLYILFVFSNCSLFGSCGALDIISILIIAIIILIAVFAFRFGKDTLKKYNTSISLYF